jgi:hypothetical protein
LFFFNLTTKIIQIYNFCPQRKDEGDGYRGLVVKPPVRNDGFYNGLPIVFVTAPLTGLSLRVHNKFIGLAMDSIMNSSIFFVTAPYYVYDYDNVYI